MHTFKNQRVILPGFALVALFLLIPASAGADRVVMKDGTKHEGTIVRRTNEVLVLETDDGNEQEYKRWDVEYFVLDRTRITLKNEDTLTGQIVSEEEDRVTIQTGPLGELTVEKAQVTERKAVEVGFAGLPPEKQIDFPPPGPWSGSIDLGYTVLRGNTTEDDFYAQASATYETKGFEDEITAKYNYATSEGATTTDRAMLSNQLNVNLGEVPYAYLRNEVGFDRVRDIGFYSENGVGGGLRLIRDDPPTLKLEAGVSHRFEDRDDSEDESEFLARVAEIFRTRLNDRVTFEQRLALLPSLSDGGEFRSEASVTFEIDLGRNLALKLIGEQLYDSDPPPGIDRQDLRFISTLGYNF